MTSELRGLRIFHRYHQAQQHRNAIERREEDVGSLFESPIRRSEFLSRKKKEAQSKRTILDRGVQTDEDEHILDDHTPGLAHPLHRFATERNPTEDESSPTSAKEFRIISLDGTYEHVSPLCTDSSSVASSRKLRDISVPRFQLPPSRVAYRKRDHNLRKPLIKPRVKPPIETLVEDSCPPKRQGKIKVTPPSGMRRSRNSHNRSRFVFDGNLSFESISPTPVFASSPNVSSSSPHRASFPMIAFPPPTTPMYMTPMTSLPMTPMTSLSMTPMTPMAPITPTSRTFDVNQSKNQEHQQKQGRLTPPPTPTEQRRRNRAMPSIQYQTLVFDQILQQQQQEQIRLRQQRHAQLSRQQTW